MASKTMYECTVCKREVGRINLRAKRVEFRTIGENGRTLKNRTVAWLCILPAVDGGFSCLAKDPDYNREAHSAAPGVLSSGA